MPKTKKPSAQQAAGQAFAPSDPNQPQPAYLAELMKNDRAQLSHVIDHIKKGYDPNQPDAEGKTPIELAMERHWIEAAMLLKEAGAIPPKFTLNPQGDPNLPMEYKSQGTVYVNQKEKMESMSALAYLISECAGVEHIISALVNGANVNSVTGRRGDSPLEITQCYGNGREWPWLATKLVKLGAWRDPAKPDPNETVNQTTGATRLLAVILEGTDYHAVERVLKEGADPNLPDKMGLTPLAAALALRWTGVEELLIKYGAKQDVVMPDPDQLVGGYNREDKEPWLSYVMRGGNTHYNFFTALLEAGANPDQTGKGGMTPAYKAAMHRHIWHLEQLYNFGADLSLGSKESGSPLAVACYNNNIEVVKWLEGRIPDEDFIAKAGPGGNTPLHLAVQRRPDCTELVQFLLDRGADPNARNDNGETPLKLAAKTKGAGEALKLLMEAAAAEADVDINARDSRGRTALDAAISQQIPDPKMVRYLLDQGADVKQLFKGDDKDNPSLFSLLALGWHDEDKNRIHAQMEVLQMLADAGVDFNIKATRSIGNANTGDSLVHYAARYSKLEIVKFLLDHGADVYGTNCFGQTMAHEYIGRHNTKGMEMLLDKGFDPLKHFDVFQDWRSGDATRYIGTALDMARQQRLHERKYDREKEGIPMTDLIEHYLFKKGIDADKIPYPEMLTDDVYDNARQLGKAERDRRRAAEEAAKPKPPRP